MKELSFEKMESLHGGVDCAAVGGFTVGFSAGLIITGAAIGIATGGLGFVVAGGLAAYFGTAGTLLCAMYN
jgi:hypothetical protein